MSYLFKWSGAEHHAEKVIVTGTFDDWSKQHELTFVDGAYQKEIDIPNPGEKVLYKFIIDGTWTTDNQCPIENDEHGIPNNVLLPSEIKPKEASTTEAATAATTTDASTTDAAAAAPAAEGSDSKSYLQTAAAAVGGVAGGGFLASILPGMGSKSTTTELAGAQPLEGAKDATVPGSFPSETPGEGTYGVNPLPATSGIGNPITLAPGEKVPDPSTFTNNTVESTVKTDAASYEKSDALPTSETAAKTLDTAAPTSTQVIPESGIPAEKTAPGDIPSNFTQSAGAGTSTAALAGAVPLEPRGVPTVVDETAPSTSAPAEGGTSTGEKAAIGGAAAAGGLAAAGGVAAAVSGASSSGDVKGMPTNLSPPDIKPTIDGTTTPQLMDEHTAPAIDYANNASPPEPVPHTVTEPSAHTASATDDSARAPISTTTNETARAPESEPPAAAAAAAPAAAPAAPEPKIDSRDVSPHTRSPTSTHPAPDVGPKPTAATAAAAAPAAAAPVAAAAAPSTSAAAPAAPTASTAAHTTTTPAAAPPGGIAAGVLPAAVPAAASKVTAPVQKAVASAAGSKPAAAVSSAVASATPSSSKASTPASTPAKTETSKKEKRKSFFGRLKEKLK